MSRHPQNLIWLRRHPAVRLRREAWGGFGFHRVTGDLLELDREGFDVAMLLGTAQTFSDLYSLPRTGAREARPQELAGFLRALEARAIIGRVPPDTPSLPCDPLAEDPVIDFDGGLRAPIVA